METESKKHEHAVSEPKDIVNNNTPVNNVSSSYKLNSLFKDKKIIPMKSVSQCIKNDANNGAKANNASTPISKPVKELEKEKILTPFLKDDKIINTIKEMSGSNLNNVTSITNNSENVKNSVPNTNLNLSKIDSNLVQNADSNNLNDRKLSNISNSTMSTNNSVPLKKSEKKGLFSSKDKSRFGFVGGNNEEIVDIPQFILELINKKTSRHWYKTRFLNEYEDQFEENTLEKSKNHAWVKFLMNMKNTATNGLEDIPVNEISKSSKSFGF